jgi:hypothetical protein
VPRRGPEAGSPRGTMTSLLQNSLIAGAIMTDGEIYLGKNYRPCCGGCEGYIIHATGSIYLCKNCQHIFFIPKVDQNCLNLKYNKKEKNIEKNVVHSYKEIMIIKISYFYVICSIILR